MAVYVDDQKNRYRGMVMCHMVADTEDELHQMADSIGIKRAWYQKHKRLPHYDISQSKRKQAVDIGAVEITARQLIEMFLGHR